MNDLPSRPHGAKRRERRAPMPFRGRLPRLVAVQLQQIRFARLGLKAQLHTCAGFTLAEVLAALMFMAILIPVAIQGLQVASRAGESAARRGEAALVADSILNQMIVTTNWNQAVQTGVVKQGFREFQWTLKNEPWSKDPNATTMRQLTIEVKYPVQGIEHSVKLSTLIDGSPPTTQSSFQQ